MMGDMWGKSGLLFSFRKYPTGTVGMPSTGEYGSMIAIYADRRVEVRRERRPHYGEGGDYTTECMFSGIRIIVGDRILEAVRGILYNYQNVIRELPNSLNNGSFDGAFNVFTFGEKEISTLNVSRSDIEEVKIRNPEYFREYYQDMLYTNALLDIYDEIADTLSEYGFIRSTRESDRGRPTFGEGMEVADAMNINDDILTYLIESLQKYANNAKEELKENPKDLFYQGKDLAYVEMMDTLRWRLEAYAKDPLLYGFPRE